MRLFAVISSEAKKSKGVLLKPPVVPLLTLVVPLDFTLVNMRSTLVRVSFWSRILASLHSFMR